MAVSNLPGPQQSVTIKNYELKNLCFWIPNIGTTGVGITVLSFRGHLQLGLMADKVLIGSNEEAQSILNQMIEEIHLMGKIFNNLDE
jgi:WS/DGAT C-terminal domain